MLTSDWPVLSLPCEQLKKPQGFVCFTLLFAITTRSVVLTGSS